MPIVRSHTPKNIDESKEREREKNETESNRMNIKTNQVLMHALQSCIQPIEPNKRDGE